MISSILNNIPHLSVYIYIYHWINKPQTAGLILMIVGMIVGMLWDDMSQFISTKNQKPKPARWMDSTEDFWWWKDDLSMKIPNISMKIPLNQWEIFRSREQLEVPIPYIFGLCFRPKFQGISPENMAKNMVRLRTSILGSWNSHWISPVFFWCGLYDID